VLYKLILEKVKNYMQTTRLNTRINQIRNPKIRYIAKRLYRDRVLYFLALPTLIWYIIFCYFPVYGIKYAFMDIGLSPVPKFVGLKNFRLIFTIPDVLPVLRNTVIISMLDIIFFFPAQIILSLLLNEVRKSQVKRTMQTVIYLPHFLSWVTVAGIWFNLLSPSIGPVNAVIKFFGGEPIYFWAQSKYFRPLLIITDMWKNLGYSTIIYLATLSSVDIQLYEAAIMDGAKRLKQTWYITLPALRPVIVLGMVGAISGILNVFGQVFVLLNPLVKDVGEVIDTYTYYMGMRKMNMGFATAVGLLKNIIGLILWFTANKTAKKLTGEGVF